MASGAQSLPTGQDEELAEPWTRVRTQPPSPPQAGPEDLRHDASAGPEGHRTELGRWTWK